MAHKPVTKRFVVKENNRERGFKTIEEAQKVAHDERMWLAEEEVCTALNNEGIDTDEHSTVARRIDSETLRVDILEDVPEAARIAVVEELEWQHLKAVSVEAGSDGRTILTLREMPRFADRVWVEDQYDSFARLLEQANKMPDCNESTFWRTLITEALDFCEYVPLCDIQQLQMSVADKEDFENGIPDGSMWVHVEAWTKLREVNFEFVVSNAAQKTGYRLDDHTRDGESYTFLVVPGKA